MNERQLQFRVGMFVIVAMMACAAMVFQFGELKSYLEPRYTMSIHFDEAPGVYRSTPVRRNGISIGQVSNIEFDEKRGGVLVQVEIQDKVRLRKDARPKLVSSLLGDASIEFSPGKSPEFLKQGSLLRGVGRTDPMQMVARLEERVTTTLDAFHQTSREWQKVAQNLNGLLDTNHENIQLVVERAAQSLHELTLTMRNTNKVFGDPKTQQALRESAAAMPELVESTRQTIAAVKRAVMKADENLANLSGVTAPLAKRSNSIITRLDNTMGHLESLSQELDDFAQLMTKEDGTLRRLISDPELYQNMNRSSASLAVLLKNLEPITHDLRIFSDKVARHPELMGVGGAFRRSSGLKDVPQAGSEVEQTGKAIRGRPARR